METQRGFSSDVAFTDTVKAIQTRKGSRRAYARMEESGAWETRINDDLRGFIEAQTSVFLATSNAAGQPYIQHRGGPAGFLKVLNDQTIAFADYVGNRQFITLGNLQENPKVHLFLMDYANQQRIKVWGTARVIESDNESNSAAVQALMPPGYKARAEQLIVLTVTAWDANCPQHIPLRLDAEQMAAEIASRDRRIDALEAELASLRASSTPTAPASRP